MCGRFAQIEPLSNIIKTFFIDELFSDLVPSYNIAPGSRILSVLLKGGKRHLVDFQWGLIPYWAKDASMARQLINARAETLLEKPSFRKAFTSRRCLIVASGFYEWKKKGRMKIPYYIRIASGTSFTFAGLYETWVSNDGVEHPTCTIITTEPNNTMKDIHNRMPVMIAPGQEGSWLDVSVPAEKASNLLVPYPDNDMVAFPVTPLVNSPAFNSPDCIVPVDPQ
jgi:putative SOS response-associated peptidase YedK